MSDRKPVMRLQRGLEWDTGFGLSATSRQSSSPPANSGPSGNNKLAPTSEELEKKPAATNEGPDKKAPINEGLDNKLTATNEEPDTEASINEGLDNKLAPTNEEPDKKPAATNEGPDKKAPISEGLDNKVAATNEGPDIWTCTMVQDEEPYIVEWIEHLAYQGISNFMIFDDRSSDNVRYLPAFYKTHNPEINVRVFKHEGEGQNEAWAKCHEMAKKHAARWIILCDVDEYVWSPNYGTLKEYMKYVESLTPEITQVSIPQERFGAGDVKERYQNQLLLDESSVSRGCAEPTWSDPQQDSDQYQDNTCQVRFNNPQGLQLMTGKAVLGRSYAVNEG